MSEIVRGATSIIRAITTKTGPKGKPVGFVENMRLGKQINSEAVRVIGSFTAKETLYNGEEGHFSWGQAFTPGADELSQLGIVPLESAQESFTPYVLSVHDNATGKRIAHLIGGVPTSADISINAQQRLTSNVSGICILTRFAGDLLAQ